MIFVNLGPGKPGLIHLEIQKSLEARGEIEVHMGVRGLLDLKAGDDSLSVTCPTFSEKWNESGCDYRK